MYIGVICYKILNDTYGGQLPKVCCVAEVYFTRGLALTLLGFAGKGYFLLLIVPGMDDGEFARYFLTVSVALIAGRILSLGAHEDLVYRVKHNAERASYYLRGTAIYYLVACVMLLQAFTLELMSPLHSAAIAYSLMLAGNGFMTGALRSYNNLFQEVNANTPWVLLCLLAFFVDIKSAEDVLLLLTICYTLIYLSNMTAVHLLGLRLGKPSIRVLIGQFMQYRAWLPKSLSSVAMAANLRSYPLWLSGLGYVLSDGLAYAFILGEVIYQLCMVYVHQIHSNLRLQDGLVKSRRLLRVGIVMIAIAAVVPLPVYYVLTSGILPESIDVSLLLLTCASIYCGTLAFFSLLRLSVWRKEKIAGSMRILVLQLLLFASVGFLVWLMKYDVMLLLVAAAINVFIMYLYIHHYQRKSILFFER